MTNGPQEVSDYYTLLNLPPSTPLTLASLKAAYHAALLRHHPDKTRSTSSPSVDIDRLRTAYHTLSDAALRAAYDMSRVRDVAGGQALQRPADVVSLDDFAQEDEDTWTYPCRCGHTYRIDTEQLEADVHAVGCSGCSEVVWVGYETVDVG